MKKRRRRTQRWKGVVPHLGQWMGRSALRILSRPQPLLLLGSLIGAGWALVSYGREADAFRIVQVSLPPQSSLQLRQPLIGANLWALDARALAEELKQQQPSLKTVRVIRQPPGAVRIEAIERIPMAQVRVGANAKGGGGGHRWCAVDREGFILPSDGAVLSEELVRIVGLERSDPPLRIGEENRHDHLQLALRILAALQQAPPSIAQRLTELNVADPQGLRFFLDGSTEVRCGSEAELSVHLERLREVLRAIANQPLEARSIDVRFKEPVIVPRAS